MSYSYAGNAIATSELSNGETQEYNYSFLQQGNTPICILHTKQIINNVSYDNYSLCAPLVNNSMQYEFTEKVTYFD